MKEMFMSSSQRLARVFKGCTEFERTAGDCRSNDEGVPFTISL
ncbi:hypothetical protein Hanom_Chr17g01575481 [Helianthus anomalus]